MICYLLEGYLFDLPLDNENTVPDIEEENNVIVSY